MTFRRCRRSSTRKRTELETLGKDVDELKKRMTAQQDKLNDDARAQLAREIDPNRRRFSVITKTRITICRHNKMRSQIASDRK